MRSAADDMWSRGSRYSGAGSSGLDETRLQQLEGRRSELTAGLDIEGAAALDNDISSLKKKIKENEKKTRDSRYNRLDRLEAQRAELRAGLDLDGAAALDDDIYSLRRELGITVPQQTARTAVGMAKAIPAGLEGFLGSNANALTAMYQGGQGRRDVQNRELLAEYETELNRRKENLAYMLEENKKSPGTWDEDIAITQNIINDLQLKYNAMYKVVNEDIERKATRESYKVADLLAEDSARRLEEAKQGVTAPGRVLIDATGSLIQNVADLGVNSLLGTPGSMGTFAMRAFGGGAQQARQEMEAMGTADQEGAFEKQLAYGLASMTKEIATEKMFGLSAPFGAAYGKGSLDDLAQDAVNRAVNRFARTAAGKRALERGLNFVNSAASEGLEELIGDWMEWQLPRIYGGEVDTAQEVLENSIYDFLVGAASGGLGDVTYRGAGRALDAVTGNTARNIGAQFREMGEDVVQAAADVAAEEAERDALMRGLEDGRILQTELTQEQIGDWDNHPDVWLDAEDKVYQMAPGDHIDQRTPETVGSRKVMAFQFDHPELHGYFSQAARSLADDLASSSRGERWSAEVYNPESGAYETKWMGQKRAVSDAVAYLLDDQQLSYADIEKALDAIINDHGQENYAAAKRVELVLDDMLTNGYTTVDGQRIAPDQAYIDAKSAYPGSMGAETAAQSDTFEELPLPDAVAAPEPAQTRTNEMPRQAPQERTEAQRTIDTARVERASSALGENGQKALNATYNGQTGAQEYYGGFSAYYQAGVSGQDINKVKSDLGKYLTKGQQYAAYSAGQNDAAASLKLERETAGFAPVAGKESGLIADDYVKSVMQSGKKGADGKAYLSASDYKKLNSVCKDLGVRAVFVDSIDGGIANAKIEGADILIAKDHDNPLRFVLGHELTHRMQELAPEEYRAFREYVAQDSAVMASVESMMELHEKQKHPITYEAALDEVTADYAGELFESSKALDSFIEQHRTDRTVLEKLRDAFRTLWEKLTGKEKQQAGEAEQKLTAALEAATAQAEQNRQNAAQTQDGEARYSINEQFGQNIQEWNKDGRPAGEQFVLGTTGPVLQGLGAIESDIYMNGDKISAILEQHPEMTIREIQRIPDILEDPVLVMKSRNVGRGGRQNTRLVMFGSVKAQDGRPVMCVLDLRPMDRGFVVSDMQKVTSAYTKDSNPVQYLQNSEILHADEKRTVPLLRTIGFHMPIELQRSGSMGSISYNKQNVNLTGEKFSDAVKTGEDSGNPRYSLKEYSPKQMKNWSESKNIVVYKDKAQLRRFIQNAVDGHNLGKKLYFGAIPADLAARIKADTGIDVENYNCTLRASEIRKILRGHGTQETELLRGQRPISEKDLMSIPEIIQNPDNITLSQKLYEGKPVILFEKTIDGKTTVVSYVSRKHHDLTVQTMYSGQKKSLATPPGEVSPFPQTSKTLSGTALEESVAQDDGDVKARYSLKRATAEEISAAEQMERDGASREDIWAETGTIRDAAGNWVSEIDDSAMEYHRRGDLGFRGRNKDYDRYRQLTEKAENFMLGKSDSWLTDQEQTELADLQKTWGGTFRKDGRISDDALPTSKLSDYIKHDELFRDYPQLRDTGLVFMELPKGTNGYYSPQQNVIALRDGLRHAPEDTLVHEIQHALQHLENRPTGASAEYWEGRVPGVDAKDLYSRTAGEIEARLAQTRRKMTVEERRARMPDLGWDRAVFSQNGPRYSLKGEHDLLQETRRLEQQARKEGWSDQKLRQERRNAVDRVYNALLQEYGAIAPGEKPARSIQVPKKTSDTEKVSQTVRTILEAKATPEEAIPGIQELVAKGDFSYETITDKEAIAKAESTITDKNWGTALSNWKKDMAAGKVSKDNTALGWALYNNAANSGNLDVAMDVLQYMVRHQRNAAQALQATRILKKLSPEGQLYGVMKSVEGLQKELNERYGDKKSPELKIDPELGKKLLEAKDQAERDAVLRDIYRDIGRQMPSRFIDKWNAWRYLSMLGNPRTHGRNILGNAGFAPVVAAKNLTATVIESAVSAVSGGRLERSKGMVGGVSLKNLLSKENQPILLGTKKAKELLSAAWYDYDNVAEAALGGGKYDDLAAANKYIEEGRVIFKGIPVASKALEAARKANSRALDAEDVWFSQPHYAYALAQFCSAHKITEAEIRKGNPQVLAAARNYAIKEAQKATYRDTNALSQTISGLGRGMTKSKNPVSRGIGFLTEGILPFRKTPANILARGLEYSPLGLIKGLSYDLAQVKQGKMTGATAIDNISAGLTGTGLLSLGVYLAAEGLVRGRGSGDDKEKDLEKLQGHQDYSLELPNGMSVTLDWLAPEALPFFVGVNLWETAQREGDVTLSEMLEAAGNVSEPMLEMSCLQSLNDALDVGSRVSSDGLGVLPSVLAGAATNYLTQGLPTIFGQGERTAEQERETTYTEKNAFLTPDMQYTLGKVSGKILGWEYQQIPYIDAWGRHESSGAAGARAFNNFLNPAYTSQIEESPVEKELLRLYQSTGNTRLFPERAGKSISVNSKTRYLSSEEYVKYAENKGQTSLKVVTALTENKLYDRLSDGEKAECIGDAYTYANQTAKKKIDSGVKLDPWVEKAYDANRRYNVPVDTYILARNSVRDIESLKDKGGESIPNSKGLLVMQKVYGIKGLNDAQRAALFADFGVGKTVIGYNRAAVDEALKKMQKQAAK